MTKLQLEQKYGIHIADDSYYNPYTCRHVKAYKMYSADGCLWDNNLKNIKAVEVECKQWKWELLSIKRYVETRKEREAVV